ncbi:MAG: VWA domain-containing protein [Gammaproteobacteria bacterium]|nr:VWA domain-containing protein [Gammaproteobacteria bacterium]
MKMKLIALGLFALTAVAVVYFPDVRGHSTVGVVPPPVQPTIQPIVAPVLQSQAPKIEVVFVLDTTGSMGGLIQAAKDKIWSIASSMASAQPAPEIKMGLVAYRDRGDEYVTRVIDLSADLDSMYATLIDFSADGGGDGPESVNKALHDAIHDISWSQDPNSYQVVFLVGDAPPHMDYQDDVQYPQTLAAAASRGIVVNTIRCGEDPQTELQWRQIASLTQGAYFSVEQAGSAIAMVTPFDDELAQLSASLDDTRLYYGSDEEREVKQRKIEATDKLHAFASTSAKARRATFNASVSGAANQFGDGDLVADVAAGRVDLKELDSGLLPEPLKALAPEERNEVVQESVRRRDDLKRQIGELAQRRDSYLASEVEASGEKEKSLDYRLFDTVRAQAEKKGLEYDAASPKY